MKVPLLIATLLGVGGILSAQNLLINPSFENSDAKDPSLPEGWRTMQRLTLGKHHFVDSTVAATGKKSIRIENSETTAGINSYMLYMQSNLAEKLKVCRPGTEMEFSVSAKVDSAKTRFRIYMETRQGERAGQSIISPIEGGTVGTWKRIVLRFKMPEQPFTSAYVCVQLTSTGKVWFDDAYLGTAANAPKEIKQTNSDSKNRIQNPSLEEFDSQTLQAAGWTPFQMNIKGSFHNLDRKFAHSGMNSLRISSEKPELSDKNFVMWKQDRIQEYLKDCPPGTPMVFSLWANTGSNPSVKFRFYVEMRLKGKFIGTFITPPRSADVGWKPFSLNFVMPKEIPDSVYVCLQLLNPGSVWFDDLWLGKATDAPAAAQAVDLNAGNFCRVTDFPPQQTWFLPDVPKKLSLEWKLPKEANGTVLVELKDFSGKLLKRDTLSAAKATIELPPLGKGSYTLNYTAGSLKEEDHFRIVEPSAKGVRFTKDRRMFLNGKSFFPVMVLTPAMSEEALRIYGEAGFNSIAFSGLTSNYEAGKFLASTAEKYGLAVIDWANLGDFLKGNEAETAQKLAERVRTARALNNFIGWLDDESEMRLIPLPQMQRFYRILFETAPEYVVWQNHAPRLTAAPGAPYGTFANVRRYSRVCDVTGIDIYPVPEGGGHSNLPNRTMSCVGEYTDLVRNTVYDQKPVWMMLQAGAWSEEGGRKETARAPRPTYEQFRFMFYNAITHGATGIIFYGPGALPDIYSPFIGMLADVNHEFKAIEKAFTEGTEVPVKATGDTKNVRIVMRSFGKDFALIAVNESKQSKQFVLQLPSETMYRLPDGKEFRNTERKLPVTLKANEVLILSTQKNVIPKHGAFSAKTVTENSKNIEQPDGALQTMKWSANWVSHPKFYRAADKTTYARQVLNLAEVPEKAWIRLTADDSYQFSINGKDAGKGTYHTIVQQYDIASFLKKGENILLFKLHNVMGPSGLLFEGLATLPGGKETTFVSGNQTRFSESPTGPWTDAHLSGVPPTAPWGKLNILIFRKE